MELGENSAHLCAKELELGVVLSFADAELQNLDKRRKCSQF